MHSLYQLVLGGAFFSALVLGYVLQKTNFCTMGAISDLILMGRESIDFNGGMVHGMVGELLGMPSFSPVMKLDLEGTTVKMAREIEGGKEQLEAQLPLIAGCQEPIAEWKIPNMRGIMSARTKPLLVVEPTSQETQAEASSFQLPPAKGSVKLVDKDQVSELVRLLKNEAKVL